MKKSMMIIGSVLVAAFLAACGGGGGSSAPAVPSALIENPAFSVPENSTFAIDAASYVANASSYKFSDNDSNADTVVSADGKSFTAPGIVISLTGSNLSVVTTNVDTTLSYGFGVVGSDDANNSAEVNATVEVVDEMDDQEVVLSDVNTSDTVIAGEDAYISLLATDPDGMESVTVEVKNANGDVLNTVVAYPDGNVTRAIGTTISVNETFSDLDVGSYSFAVMAQGIVSGEGDRSFIQQEYNVSVVQNSVAVDSIIVKSKTYYSVTLQFNAFDADGATQLELYRNDMLIKTFSDDFLDGENHTYTDTGLVSSSLYNYEIRFLSYDLGTGEYVEDGDSVTVATSSMPQPDPEPDCPAGTHMTSSGVCAPDDL